MKKVNKVLLVVTFFHRTETLKALENYYHDKNVDILFIDQSYTQHVTTTSLKNVLEIVHYPADKVNFYEMWLKVFEKYGDHYSYFVWNNDDDFTVAESIVEIEAFLNTDYGKDFSLVTGQVFQINSQYHHIARYATFEVHKDDVVDADPMERLRKVFSVNGVHVNPHAVIKSDVFKSCCELILETQGRPNCLMPIRFFDKIITAVAAIKGFRKTNFDNITSVRTERSFTGSLMKRPDFPACLEKNVSYDKVIERLSTDNVLAKKFKLDSDLLLQYIKPSNITEGHTDFSKNTPHKKHTSQIRVNEVKDAIKSSR